MGEQSLHRSTKVSAYDHESGQMYEEQTVRLTSRKHSDWIGEYKTPSLIKRSVPNDGHGTRSLVDSMVIQLAGLSRSLTEEHFETIPWCLGEKIWLRVLATHRESFHFWRILVGAYPEQLAKEQNRYHLHIPQPTLSLPDYFHGLISPTRKWLTSLRISPKETRIADLISVATIPNLTVLDLSDGQNSISMIVSPFNERIFRTWADLARAGQAFQHLEALFFGWQNLDAWLFQYLPNFPALKKVVVTDSPRLHQKNRKDWEPLAVEYGWEARHAKRSAKSLRSVLDGSGFYKCSVSGIMSQFDTNASTAAARPVVECWLGSPLRWHHILDDFPGTRTIYFDRTRMPGRQALAQTRSNDTVKRAHCTETLATNATPPPKRMTKNTLKLQQKAMELSNMLKDN